MNRRLRVMLLIVSAVCYVACVTEADIRHADDRDQRCWSAYCKMARRESETVDDDIRVEGQRLRCVALDRQFDRLASKQREQEERRESAAGVAGAIVGGIGAGLAGAGRNQWIAAEWAVSMRPDGILLPRIAP